MLAATGRQPGLEPQKQPGKDQLAYAFDGDGCRDCHDNPSFPCARRTPRLPAAGLALSCAPRNALPSLSLPTPSSPRQAVPSSHFSSTGLGATTQQRQQKPRWKQERGSSLFGGMGGAASPTARSPRRSLAVAP